MNRQIREKSRFLFQSVVIVISTVIFGVLFACTSLRQASYVSSQTSHGSPQRKLASHIHPKYMAWCKEKWEQRVGKHKATTKKHINEISNLRIAYINNNCEVESFTQTCLKIQHNLRERVSFLDLHKSNTEPIIEEFYESCPFIDVDKDRCADSGNAAKCDGCHETDPSHILDRTCCIVHGHFPVWQGKQSVVAGYWYCVETPEKFRKK